MLERLTPDGTSIGREGGRKGGREGGREGEREGEREGVERGREEGEGRREGGRKGKEREIERDIERERLRHCGSVIPTRRKLCISPERLRDNLALSLQATVETRRGRVGIASQRRRSRRRRRLENRRLRQRRQCGRMFDATVHRRTNYMTTALGSIKPLPKYKFVLLDVIQSSSIPPRLQQLLLQDSASIQVK